MKTLKYGEGFLVDGTPKNGAPFYIVKLGFCTWDKSSVAPSDYAYFRFYEETGHIIRLQRDNQFSKAWGKFTANPEKFEIVNFVQMVSLIRLNREYEIIAQHNLEILQTLERITDTSKNAEEGDLDENYKPPRRIR